MPFRLSSRSRAWFGNGALSEAPRLGHGTLRWLFIALVACSAPDARDLFVALPSNGDSNGVSGSGGAAADIPDGSAPAADGGGREGQGGTLNLAGAGGDAGNGSAGPPLLDAGLADAADAAAVTDGGVEPPACVATREVCDGLDNDCDSVSDQGATCVAECDGFTIDGRGYMFCSSAVSRPEALGRCQLEGMHLVWIDSEGEQSALIESIAAADVPLPPGNPEILTQIGAGDGATEGVWRWVGTDTIADSYQFWQGGAVAQGGAPVGGAFANWDDTEPNNGNDEDCALMSVLGGGGRAIGAWDDRGCEVPFAFTCESN